MFHLEEGLRREQPASRRLKQWEYTDSFEELCKSSFEGYGIKLVNGKNKLSGPGIKMEEDLTPGMGAIQMGGDSWTKRLAEECRKIVFEKGGEEEMYDMFYAGFKKQADSTVAIDFGSVFKDVCDKELRFCKAGPDAPPSSKAAKKEKKPKEAKKAEKKAPAAKKAEKKPKEASPEIKKETAAPPTSDSTDLVDVQTFLRNLALKHGMTADEYTSERSEKSWEKLMISMASRIFNKQSQEL